MDSQILPMAVMHAAFDNCPEEWFRVGRGIRDVIRGRGIRHDRVGVCGGDVVGDLDVGYWMYVKSRDLEATLQMRNMMVDDVNGISITDVCHK